MKEQDKEEQKRKATMIIAGAGFELLYRLIDDETKEGIIVRYLCAPSAGVFPLECAKETFKSLDDAVPSGEGIYAGRFEVALNEAEENIFRALLRGDGDFEQLKSLFRDVYQRVDDGCPERIKKNRLEGCFGERCGPAPRAHGRAHGYGREGGWAVW